MQIPHQDGILSSEDKFFEAAVESATGMGCRMVEPMVHNGRELLSVAGYFQSFTTENRLLEMKEILG